MTGDERAKGGGLLRKGRKVMCKRKEGGKGVRLLEQKEARNCMSEVGGCWNVEGVKVDLV